VPSGHQGEQDVLLLGVTAQRRGGRPPWPLRMALGRIGLHDGQEGVVMVLDFPLVSSARGKKPAHQMLRMIRTKGIAGNAPFSVCIVMKNHKTPAGIFNYVAACAGCVR